MHSSFEVQPKQMMWNEALLCRLSGRILTVDDVPALRHNCVEVLHKAVISCPWGAKSDAGQAELAGKLLPHLCNIVGCQCGKCSSKRVTCRDLLASDKRGPGLLLITGKFWEGVGGLGQEGRGEKGAGAVGEDLQSTPKRAYFRL